MDKPCGATVSTSLARLLLVVRCWACRNPQLARAALALPSSSSTAWGRVGLAGITPEAAAAHNAAAAAALADTEVVGALRRWHAMGRSPRALLSCVSLALGMQASEACRGARHRTVAAAPEAAAAAAASAAAAAHTPPSSSAATHDGDVGMFAASHILRACEALNRQALESTLPDVSPLEASLLGAMAHLETLGGDERSAPPYNFDMAFREYGRFTRAQGATTLPAHRDVALKAFERLVAHGLVVMTAVAPEAGEATRSAAHMSRHSQLLRLGLEPEVFVDAVRQGTLELPTALRHWIVHGEQT